LSFHFLHDVRSLLLLDFLSLEEVPFTNDRYGPKMRAERLFDVLFNIFGHFEVVGCLRLVRAHLFQERHEWHEAFIVFGFAELLHETLGLLLGQLLTEVGQQPEELVAEDGAVIVLVVELEDLDEVVDAAGVLGGLGLGEDGVEVLDLHHPLALLLLAAELVDGVEGGVDVAGPQQVADVEPIDLAVSLEVVHIKGKLDLFDIARVEAVLLSYFLIVRHVCCRMMCNLSPRTKTHWGLKKRRA